MPATQEVPTLHTPNPQLPALVICRNVASGGKLQHEGCVESNSKSTSYNLQKQLLFI